MKRLPTHYKMITHYHGKEKPYTLDLIKTVNFTDYHVKTFTCNTAKEVDAICNRIIERIENP